MKTLLIMLIVAGSIAVMTYLAFQQGLVSVRGDIFPLNDQAAEYVIQKSQNSESPTEFVLNYRKGESEKFLPIVSSLAEFEILVGKSVTVRGVYWLKNVAQECEVGKRCPSELITSMYLFSVVER